MGEQRYRLLEDSNGLKSIFDNDDEEDEPLIYGAMFGTEKIVDLLNEQDNLIKNQHKIIIKMLKKIDDKIIETEQEYDKAIKNNLDTREIYLKRKFLLELKMELKQL